MTIVPSAPTAIRPPSSGSKRLVQDVVNGVLQRLLEIGHAGGNVVGDGVADELLADAGAADGAGGVVGIGARADDRRIADAAVFLVRPAAGRSAGGQVAVRVEGHAADGAVVRILRSDCATACRLRLRLRAFSQLLRAASRCRTMSSRRARLCISSANFSAPSLVSSTCFVFSMTSRASEIGCRTVRTAATAAAGLACGRP